MSDWKEFSIGEIADPADRYSFSGGPFGSNLKSEEYTEGGVRIIQLQNIGDGHFKDNYKIYTSEEKADELLSCNIYPGEIILSKMGDPVARATLIPDSEERYLMASDGIRLKVDTTRFDSTFILNAINSPQFRSSAEAVSVGSTRKRIGLTTLKGLTIYAPPLPEQKKIAEILSGIDLELASGILKLDKLTKLLQALAEEEVCMRFREIPALPLSSFFADKPSNGISPPETEGGDFISAPGIDCISKSGFDTKRLKKVQRPPDWERYLIREGDFFITRANTPSLVGMCAVAKKITQEMIYPDLMVRLKFAHADHGPYLESVFRSSFYRRIIQNSAQGTSQSMAKLNGQIISSIKISMPADSEVHRFNKNIGIISETIKSQQIRIERLQKMKAGLASDLLSGRKRVSDARVLEGVGT
jgi:restriction endonuclease S subunit